MGVLKIFYYHFTGLKIPWSRALVEKLIVTQVVKKFLFFYTGRLFESQLQIIQPLQWKRDKLLTSTFSAYVGTCLTPA
jgi:hypothetical protein